MNEDQLPALINGRPWDAAQFDPARSEFVRKCKAVRDLRIGDTTEKLSVPGRIWINEPFSIGGTGFPDQPDKTGTNARDFYEFYGGCKAFGAAAAAMFVRCLGNQADSNEETARIRMPDATTLACIRASVKAWLEIPNVYAEGSYARGDANGTNTSLALLHYDDWADRTYELRNGPTSIAFVLGRYNHRGASGLLKWRKQYQDGAREVQAFGYDSDPNFFATTRG